VHVVSQTTSRVVVVLGCHLAHVRKYPSTSVGPDSTLGWGLSVKGKAKRNEQSAPDLNRIRERSHVPSRLSSGGKRECCPLLSCQAFTCLEAAARFLQGFKTHSDPPTQLLINTAHPISFRIPAPYTVYPDNHIHI
jgi:hypothetical protein